MNPIENEAVVTEIMRQHKNEIRLIDLHEKLAQICPGFRAREGLKT